MGSYENTTTHPGYFSPQSTKLKANSILCLLAVLEFFPLGGMHQARPPSVNWSLSPFIIQGKLQQSRSLLLSCTLTDSQITSDGDNAAYFTHYSVNPPGQLGKLFALNVSLVCLYWTVL